MNVRSVWLEMKCLIHCSRKCVYPGQNIGVFIFKNFPVVDPPPSFYLNGAPPPQNFQSKKCKELTAVLRLALFLKVQLSLPSEVY
jgi:hypothetical protein